MSSGHDAAPHIPFVGDDVNVLLPPPVAPSRLESGFSSPRDSYAASQTLGTPTQSAHLIEIHDTTNRIDGGVGEKASLKRNSTVTKNRKSLPFLFVGGLAFLIVVVAVILPVYFLIIRPKQHHSSASTQISGSPAGPVSTSTPGKNPSPVSNTIMGSDGSLVTTSDGSSFTYKNPFGGYWVSDPSDPYNKGGKAQSWVPALNESWTFGKDLIHGCEHLFSVSNAQILTRRFSASIWEVTSRILPAKGLLTGFVAGWFVPGLLDLMSGE